MKRYWHMLRLSFRLKRLVPVKMYCASRIQLRPGAKLINASRLILGNPDKNGPIVSVVPVNIWIGAYAVLKTGTGVNFGPGVNIIVKQNAVCELGDNTYITSDSHLETVNKIVIGKNCAISWGVTIIDDDHHCFVVNGTGKDSSGQVCIGDHVWIGCNVTILKNTVIGNNCIIAAGSVVKGSFPDGSLIAGSPAKVVKENVQWK